MYQCKSLVLTHIIKMTFVRITLCNYIIICQSNIFVLILFLYLKYIHDNL